MAASKRYELAVDGLNDVLRAFRKLPKEASGDLRDASVRIADKHMVPAWQNAALNYAGPWGQVIADSVRAKRDRVPAVNIGGNRKAMSGGASATMVRYPSDKGSSARSGVSGRMPAAFGDGTDWIASATGYGDEAIREWSLAVDLVCAKWSYL